MIDFGPPEPKRLRYQCSLRTLLLLVAVANIGLACFGGCCSRDNVGRWFLGVVRVQANRLGTDSVLGPARTKAAIDLRIPLVGAVSNTGAATKPADVITTHPTESDDRTENTQAIRRIAQRKSVRKRPPFITPNQDWRTSPNEIPRVDWTPPARTRVSHGNNGGALFGVMIIVVVVVVALVAWAGDAHRRQLVEIYSRLAKHYGGYCDPGSWGTQPKVDFVHAGSHVVVDSCSTGGKVASHFTQIHFRGLHPIVRCEVYPDGMWPRFKRLMGMEDIEIGSPDFDERYIITGENSVALRDLLTAPLQIKIEHLRRLLGNNHIYVSFNKHELLVKKLSIIRDYYLLSKFTEQAIELYDQAILTAQKGIEFVQSTSPPDVKEAVCQICGETIQTDAVLCRRCKTPHHRDCWEYYGACSTYGCGERGFILPKREQGKRPGKSIDGSTSSARSREAPPIS